MCKLKRESVFARRRQQKTVRGRERREADGGVPPVRFKTPTELAGARRLRWSPASNHGELGETEGTKSFSVFFRVGGWWTRPTGSTTSTATLSPADGGSGEDGELRWRAASFKLKCGSEREMHGEVTGKRMEAEEHTRGRIGLDPVAGRGGRSWGRRLPRGSSSGLAWYWWCVEVVWVRVRARGLLL